ATFRAALVHLSEDKFLKAATARNYRHEAGSQIGPRTTRRSVLIKSRPGQRKHCVQAPGIVRAYLLEKTIPRLAEALKGLKWALERKPYVFDKIEKMSGLRLAKLEGLQNSDTRLPWPVSSSSEREDIGKYNLVKRDGFAFRGRK